MIVGIDFETANKNPNSACSIGIVVIGDSSNIIEEKHYLIKPPSDFFEFTHIHGLTYADVESSKTFGELWPEIKEYFNNNILFVHNAKFDIGVLKALFKLYDLQFENIEYFCTLELSKKLFPLMRKHNLKYVSDKLNFKFNHHNALEDAKASSEIVKFGFRKHKCNIWNFIKKDCING